MDWTVKYGMMSNAAARGPGQSKEVNIRQCWLIDLGYLVCFVDRKTLGKVIWSYGNDTYAAISYSRLWKGVRRKVYDVEVFGLSSATPYLEAEIPRPCPRSSP